MKLKYNNYRHFWLALYFVVYILWYILDESIVKGSYTAIEIAVDRYIPFCEYFVIPYVLWYPFMAVVGVFLLLREKNDFCRYMWSMIIGLSFCLTMYLVFPNGQELRPEAFARDNFCTRLVGSLYAADSNTNVFPSMHVYGTIAPLAAFLKTEELRGKKLVKISSTLLGVLICLSTAFIKQHSALDLIGGAVLFVPIYVLVYGAGKNLRLWTWPAEPLFAKKERKSPHRRSKKRTA